jgi:membrane protease YdiL (CAAX protease family)
MAAETIPQRNAELGWRVVTSASVPPSDPDDDPTEPPATTDTAIATDHPVARPYTARSIRVELLIVFAVTLGTSGLSSLVGLIDSVLAPAPLASQTVSIIVPQAQASFLDLLRQLLNILRGFAWGALGLYLLWRSGVNLRTRLGLDLRKPWADLGVGVALAAVIGIPGLLFYLFAVQIGINLTVAPTTLNDVWWRMPVLIMGAIENGFLEEVLVVGYLLTRLQQLKVPIVAAVAISAVLRGSYHLYQGFGGFLGNAVMGVVFAVVFLRTRRLWPLVIAHSLLDIVAFVGYAALKGTVGWLP